MTAEAMEKHESDDCPKREIGCSLGCGTIILADQQQEHRDTVCPEQLVGAITLASWTAAFHHDAVIAVSRWHVRLAALSAFGAGIWSATGNSNALTA